MLVVIGVIIWVLSQPEPEQKKREFPVGDGPGMFNKAEGKSAFGTSTDPPKTADSTQDTAAETPTPDETNP